MTLRTRFNVLTIVLLGLSTFCYGSDNCGFGIGCPNVAPPCYRVEFSGVRECSDMKCIDFILHDFLNKTWKLKKLEDECEWTDSGTDLDYNALVEAYEGGVHVEDMQHEAFLADGPHPDGVNIGNDLTCHDCRRRGGGGFAGMASYEAVWDCNWCGNCGGLPIEVYDKARAYYPNKNCCPLPSKGECIVAMKCEDADYVVVNCFSSDPNVATVTADPNGCSQLPEPKGKKRVTFTITTFPATPPIIPPVTVTCTASFYDAIGNTNSVTVVKTIEPGCTDCCRACVGGAGVCFPLSGPCDPGVILPPMPK